MEERTFIHTSLKFWKTGGGFTVGSRGASEGLGTLWDNTMFELVDLHIDVSQIYGSSCISL